MGVFASWRFRLQGEKFFESGALSRKRKAKDIQTKLWKKVQRRTLLKYVFLCLVVSSCSSPRVELEYKTTYEPMYEELREAKNYKNAFIHTRYAQFNGEWQNQLMLVLENPDNPPAKEDVEELRIQCEGLMRIVIKHTKNAGDFEMLRVSLITKTRMGNKEKESIVGYGFTPGEFGIDKWKNPS